MQILRIVVCTAYSKINLNGKWRVRAIFKDSCLSTCKYTCNGVRANPTARIIEGGFELDHDVRSGILLCTNARRIFYMGFTLLLDMFVFGLNMINGAELNHNLKRTSKREQL